MARHVVRENEECEVCRAVDGDLFMDVGCEATDIVNPISAVGWWLTPTERGLGIDIFTKQAAFPVGPLDLDEWSAAWAAWREEVAARQEGRQ